MVYINSPSDYGINPSHPEYAPNAAHPIYWMKTKVEITGLAAARTAETDLDENARGYDAPMRGEIVFEDVTFHYPGSSRMTHEGLSFTVGAGERVGSGDVEVEGLLEVPRIGVEQGVHDLSFDAELAERSGPELPERLAFLRWSVPKLVQYSPTDLAELVEYLRVGAQLVFMELHPRPTLDPSDSLHLH